MCSFLEIYKHNRSEIISSILNVKLCISERMRPFVIDVYS